MPSLGVMNDVCLRKQALLTAALSTRLNQQMCSISVAKSRQRNCLQYVPQLCTYHRKFDRLFQVWFSLGLDMEEVEEIW